MAAPKGNKNAVGNDGGQNPFFETPEALQTKIDDYFQFIKGEIKEEREAVNHKTGRTELVIIWEREPEPPTITGLALFLGFCSRQSLHDYEEKIEFSYIIKKARTKVENGYEKNLHGNNPAGSVFALKNMGWTDRTQTEVTGKDGAPFSIRDLVGFKDA